MEKNDNLENSLFDALTSNSLELSGDIIEFTVDQFLDNDLINEIPFFSIFYKSVKTVKGIREALFAMKVYKFLKEFEKIKQNEKSKFLKIITIDRKERIRVGQTLIMILDKIIEVDKTEIIANLFAGFMKSELTRSELTQLSSIVEKIFLDDLLLFSKMNKGNNLPVEIQANLSSAGLMRPIILDIKSMYGNSVIIDDEHNENMIVYLPSNLGLKMQNYIKVNNASRKK